MDDDRVDQLAQGVDDLRLAGPGVIGQGLGELVDGGAVVRERGRVQCDHHLVIIRRGEFAAQAVALSEEGWQVALGILFRDEAFDEERLRALVGAGRLGEPSLERRAVSARRR
ncbi:hypothetical protein [Salinarimonas sp.]|uniref:hypothetical protein n=1 Tax=Salinarimonas sp. TaxID=2766526 RepID=UPI00391C36C5